MPSTLRNDRAGAPRTMGKTTTRFNNTNITPRTAPGPGGPDPMGAGGLATEPQSLGDIERILGPNWRQLVTQSLQNGGTPLNLPGFGQATGGRHEFGGNAAIAAAMKSAGWTPQQQALWLAQGLALTNPQSFGLSNDPGAGANNGTWTQDAQGGWHFQQTGNTGQHTAYTLEDLANNPWFRAHGVTIPGTTVTGGSDPAAPSGPLPAAGNPAPSPNDPFAVPQPGTPNPTAPAPTNTRPAPIPDPAGPAAKAAAPAPAPSPFSVTPKPPQASDALGASTTKTVAPSPFAGSAAGVSATTGGADVDKTDNTPSPQPPQPKPVAGPKPPVPDNDATPSDTLASGAKQATPPSPFDPNAQRPKFATGPNVTAATAAQTPSSSLQGY